MTEAIGTWVAISKEAFDDLPCGACLFHIDFTPLTTQEKRSGYRYFTCARGHANRYPVGWRKAKLDAEYERQRAAEMAACPYVACTCGHHEE